MLQTLLQLSARGTDPSTALAVVVADWADAGDGAVLLVRGLVTVAGLSVVLSALSSR